jgi:hypothetical protein
MVKHLTDLPTVEPEMCMAEMRKSDDCKEQNQIRVVQLALGFEGVVSQLVAVRLIVNVGFVFPVMTTRIAAEDMDVAARTVKKPALLT